MRQSRRPLLYVGNEAAAPAAASTVTCRVVATVVVAILAASAVVIGIAGLILAYDAYRGESAQETRSDQLEALQASSQNVLSAADAQLQAQITLVNTTLCNKVAQVNETVTAELQIIGGFLNASSTNTTFTEVLVTTIDSVVMPQVMMIENTITVLQMDVDTRVQTINGVTVGNGTNIDLVGGDGVSVNPGPGTTDLTLSNTGVLSVVASGVGLEAAPAVGDVVVQNTGVVTVNGVPSSDPSRNLQLLGTGGVDVMPDVNASSITLDGSVLVTAINNLQMTDANQAMQIMDLQTTDASLQSQINSLEQAGTLMTDMMNGTTVTLNMTLLELLTDVMNAQNDIALLQSQIVSIMSGSIPSGAIMPFAGAGPIPAGYLLCDGATYNTSDYEALFAVIGEVYCTMPAPTDCAMGEFQVPDLRGRVPVGRKDSGVFNIPVGTIVGSETHVLDVTELPGHTHSGTVNSDGGHTHTVGDTSAPSSFQLASHNFGTPVGSDVMCSNDVIGYQLLQPPLNCVTSAELIAQNPNTVTGSSSAHTHTVNGGGHTHTFTTDTGTGSDNAHPNVQPSLVMQYIIKI